VIAYLRSNWLLLILLALCIGRLWLMPLPSSFWTDEMGTAFIVERPADPSLAAVPQLPVSIYYALPRAADKLFGLSEIAYRMPSVLLMGLALFVVGKLASRLIDPAAAWFGVFACLALGDLDYYAADARPYALGICVACLTVWFLIRWLDTNDWKRAVLFVVFGALLWRVQLVFWPFYPVLAAYALVRRRSWTVIVYFALLAIALLPVAIQAIHIFQAAGAHTFAAMPSVKALARAASWKMVLFWGAVPLVFRKSRQRAASGADLVLIVLWWLWMPLCLFVFSRATGTVLFVPRYFSLILPGIALATTAAVALYLPPNRWKLATAVMAVGALIAQGHWHSIWYGHTEENWKQASADVNDTPVIAISPFIEAQPPVWIPDYPLPGFLYAQLFVYPVRGMVYPFPFLATDRTKAYAAGLLADTLVQRGRFIVYGVDRGARPWISWFAGRPELAGWQVTQAGSGVIDVAVFSRGILRANF
jgi:hypothetical protein